MKIGNIIIVMLVIALFAVASAFDTQLLSAGIIH